MVKYNTSLFICFLTGVQAVAGSCPLLNIVYLRRCVNVTDTAIIALASSCRQLVELNIGGCQQITDASLVAIGQNCRLMRCLNVSKTRVRPFIYSF